MELLTLITISVIWLICSFIAGGIAAGQDRDGAIWMLVGFVFGPLAILPLLFFPLPKPRVQPQRAP